VIACPSRTRTRDPAGDCDLHDRGGPQWSAGAEQERPGGGRNLTARRLERHTANDERRVRGSRHRNHRRTSPDGSLRLEAAVEGQMASPTIARGMSEARKNAARRPTRRGFERSRGRAQRQAWTAAPLWRGSALLAARSLELKHALREASEARCAAGPGVHSTGRGRAALAMLAVAGVVRQRIEGGGARSHDRNVEVAADDGRMYGRVAERSPPSSGSTRGLPRCSRAEGEQDEELSAAELRRGDGRRRRERRDRDGHG